MTPSLDRDLDRLLVAAKSAFPDEIEPSPNFLPEVWQKIEAAAPTAWFGFVKQWSPRLALAGATAALLVMFAAQAPEQQERRRQVVSSSYLDTLTVQSLDEHDGAMWILAGNHPHPASRR